MHVAFLRGINVGGKAILPMAALRQIFAEASATRISTYIHSGNVVFAHPTPEACVAQVTRVIAKTFAYPGRIVLRSAAELQETFNNNPFLKVGADPTHCHVYFLADAPKVDSVKLLDPMRSTPDAFAVYGREIYLHLPDGMARTKLTNAYFDKHLATVSTARNWNTIGKLMQMLANTEVTP